MRAPSLVGGRAAAVLQLRLMTRQVDAAAPLLVTSLFAIPLLGFIHSAGDPSMATSTVVAATLMVLWSTVVFVGSDIIEDDRAQGVLEAVGVSAVSYPVFLAIRISVSAALAFPAIVVVVVIARLFALPVTLHHPAMAVADLIATWICATGVGVLLSCMLTLSSAARTFQNALTYPFYVVGGILVSPALLPLHLGTVSPIVFLSHSAQLGRRAFTPGPQSWAPLGWLALLATVHVVLAALAARAVERRLKVLGTASYG